MNISRGLRLLSVLCILCIIFNPSYQTCYSIKNPASGLVLDASEYHVKIRHFTRKQSQLWKLEPDTAGHNTMYIINVGNGKALQKENPQYDIGKVITKAKDYSTAQEWVINSDEIADSKNTNVLDIQRQEYFSGNIILTYSRGSYFTAHQKFELVKQYRC